MLQFLSFQIVSVKHIEYIISESADIGFDIIIEYRKTPDILNQGNGK